MMISDSIIDVPIDGSNDKDDIMPEKQGDSTKSSIFRHDMVSPARKMDWNVNGAIWDYYASVL